MNPKLNDEKSLTKIKEKHNEVKVHFGQLEFFNNYILEVLNSFAYRYFDSALPAEVVSPGILRVYALEKGIKEAIKIKNPELRLGIAELVKRVSKEQGPTILREIRIELIKKNATAGSAVLTSRISFGHPDHLFTDGSYIEKKEIFIFEDEIAFRNTLAKHLDNICELF